MKKSGTPEDKVIAAFKGFMNSYKLEPYDAKLANTVSDYHATFSFFDCADKTLQLFYKKTAHVRLIDQVDALFAGQTDRAKVSGLLNNAVLEWIEQGHNKDNQTKLERAGTKFLASVEELIRDYILYIPIEGLNSTGELNLRIGRCQAYRNGPNSELMQLVRQRREKWPKESLSSFEQSSVFLKVKSSGHFRQAVQHGIDEAELALNVLRLFWSSAYINTYQVPRRMGLVGTIHQGAHSGVLGIQDNVPIEGQFPGSSVEADHYRPFELRDKVITSMESLGLNRINQLLLSLATGNGEDVARRLLRAINWFGKAAAADSIVDSFLMYAISVEGLLSEGRTPQNVYALQMAALVTGDSKKTIIPVGGSVSSEFSRELRSASGKSERFNVVKNRTDKLFQYRNSIAHGMLLENEIEPVNLLDFETLVRNSILSFVAGGWSTLGEFKSWMNQSVSFRFTPPRRCIRENSD